MRLSENSFIAAGYITADANVTFQKGFYKFQHCSYMTNLFTEKKHCITQTKMSLQCLFSLIT